MATLFSRQDPSTNPRSRIALVTSLDNSPTPKRRLQGLVTPKPEVHPEYSHTPQCFTQTPSQAPARPLCTQRDKEKPLLVQNPTRQQDKGVVVTRTLNRGINSDHEGLRFGVECWTLFSVDGLGLMASLPTLFLLIFLAYELPYTPEPFSDDSPLQSPKWSYKANLSPCTSIEDQIPLLVTALCCQGV